MTRIDRSVMFNSLVLSLVLYSSWIQICYSSKVKSFECQVCEELAKELYNQYKNKKKDLQMKYKLEKDKEPNECTTEISENVCNLAQAVGDTLKFFERDLKGQCDSESKTIEKSCLQKVIGKVNPMKAASYVCGTDPTEMSLVDHLCKDNTEACSAWNNQAKEPNECITENSENVCNLEQAVEQRDNFKHIVLDLKGQCDSESKAIEKSCLQKVIGKGNPTDAAVYVCGRNPTEMSSLDNHLCQVNIEACSVWKSEEKVNNKKVSWQKIRNKCRSAMKRATGIFRKGKKKDNRWEMPRT